MGIHARGGQARFIAAGLLVAALVAVPARSGMAGEEAGWIDLTGGGGLGAWRKPWGAWLEAGDARPRPGNGRLLEPIAGKGTIVNGRDGRTSNLLSVEEFGDVEVRLEFLIPEGSNSGIKLEGLYEIQIVDSRSKGEKNLSGRECGGIYPRAELLPRYRYLDDGHPPKRNAARAAGEWQSLEVVFRAPRFDGLGKKTAGARMEKVVLNGVAIHESLDLGTPTGHAWHLPEVRRGPLLLQADHGPVAFRNVRVRKLE
ncbi:3-keto-disaccharide hydrolase [Aquisphaera insulae]|uniref:3-keto-disaccharide hydrolase n=1 Tax=Aquisphaera insulae TaxID=2712864 RepID=UPI0013EC8EE2|nr:DUF1080 domain-containing protein [Aquisphaera insulae]